MYTVIPADTRKYYSTLTCKNMVFTGAGAGTGKNTRRLPVSLPRDCTSHGTPDY